MIKKLSKLGIAAAALAGLAANAQAGGVDAAYAPAPTWSGVYAGLNAGVAWTEFDNTLRIEDGVRPFFSSGAPSWIPAVNNAGRLSDDTTDITGGAQIGVNMQTGNWVMGVEGDFNYLDSERNRSVSAEYPGSTSSYRIETSAGLDWLMTLRGRLGYATNGLLLYGTAGLAVADIEFSQSFNEPGFTTAPLDIDSSKTKAGVAVGGGVEWMLYERRGLSFKGEYLYAAFDDASFSGSTAGPLTPGVGTFGARFNDSVDVDLHVVRVGINKQLGGVE